MVHRNLIHINTRAAAQQIRRMSLHSAVFNSVNFLNTRGTELHVNSFT
jgi:hypothetical protein